MEKNTTSPNQCLVAYFPQFQPDILSEFVASVTQLAISIRLQAGDCDQTASVL